MNVAIQLPTGHSAPDSWRPLVEYVIEAERLGVARVWSAEAWNQDALTPLAYLAARTQRIGLGTGIAQVGTRTPALLAMSALTMAWMTGGRFTLGLGTSGPQVMEGWHGVRFHPPVSRLRETVEIVRMVTRGERLRYDGSVYRLPLPDGEGKALRTGIEPQHVAIHIAALGPRALELTGAQADGWLGTLFAPEWAEVFVDHLRAGADRAGRRLADLELQASVTIDLTDDVDRAVERLKPGVAFTLGAMGSSAQNFYQSALRRTPHADAARRVQQLWLDGDHDAAATAVPDDLVESMHFVGTPDRVRERVRRYHTAGITTVKLQPVGASLDECLAVLGRAVELVTEATAPSPSTG